MMALNEQNPQAIDNAPLSGPDPKRQQRLDKVMEIVNRFANRPPIGGREQWLRWVNQDEISALSIWDDYISKNPDVIANLTPLELRQLYNALGFTKFTVDRRAPRPKNPAPASANAATTASATTTAPAGKPAPRQRPAPAPASPKNPPQEQEEARTWFANVFQKFYGAGVGEPNGYQYSIAQDPQTGARQIRIFQDPNDAARSFVFVQQPNGVWELRSGTGQPIMGNVHYDPQLRRFFALGVSEGDILKALQQLKTDQQQQQDQQRKDSNQGPNRALPAGVVNSFPLADGSVFTVSVDGIARVLRPLGDNQWAVVMERSLQELLSTQQPTTETQSSEQIPSWMLLLMTLFLLMGRR